MKHASNHPSLWPPELGRIDAYMAYGAATFPERDALILDSHRMSYHQCAAEVERIARALLASGIRPGDRVAMLDTSRPEFFLVFLATASIGAIWIGLNPKYSKRELEHPLVDGRPSLVFCRDTIDGRQFVAEVMDIVAARRLTTEIVSLSRVAGDGEGAGWPEFISRGERTSPDVLSSVRAKVQPGDGCLIVYTSGTSGTPKGALLTHRGLIYCCRTDAKYSPTLVDHRAICNFPINHIACVGDVCCNALVAGGTIVFMEEFDPGGVLRAIERHRVTSLGQIPAMLQMIFPNDDPPAADLSSLKLIVWGGNPASTDLVRRLRRICPTLGNVYGMTETTGNVLFLRGAGFDDITLADTVGWPPPDYEVELFDDEGKVPLIGEAGEIHVRGTYLMQGYWHLQEATRNVFTPDGWLKTGDIAKRREDGAYSIVGRRSEMFKSGGYNVYPAEVEKALEGHPSVALAAVVGVPDSLYSEVGAAFVLSSDPTLTAETLRTFARSMLANYKVPKSFHFMERMPMLSNGKIDKRALATQAAG